MRGGSFFVWDVMEMLYESVCNGEKANFRLHTVRLQTGLRPVRTGAMPFSIISRTNLYNMQCESQKHAEQIFQNTPGCWQEQRLGLAGIGR